MKNNKESNTIETQNKEINNIKRSIKKLKIIIALLTCLTLIAICLSITSIVGFDRIYVFMGDLLNKFHLITPLIKEHVISLWKQVLRVFSIQKFKSREIATIIWLAILTIILMVNKTTRKSISDVCRILFTRLFITLFISICVYTSLILACLSEFNLWDVTLLKETIIWIVFTAFVVCIKSSPEMKKTIDLKKMFVDNFKIVLLIEFISNAYSFNLLTEIIFLPMILFIVICSTYIERKTEYSKVRPIFSFVQAVFGIAIIWNGIWGFIINIKTISMFDTVKDFALTPLLNIAFIPFIYGFAIFIVYDSIKTRLKMGSEKPPKLINYCMRRIFYSFNINLFKLNDFLTKHVRDLMRIKEENEINRILKNYHA
jgi:hypothetical protein